MKKIKAARRLEPITAYDPYRPRVYGDALAIEESLNRKAIADIDVTNEAFASAKQKEIAERTRQEAGRTAEALAESIGLKKGVPLR